MASGSIYASASAPASSPVRTVRMLWHDDLRRGESILVTVVPPNKVDVITCESRIKQQGSGATQKLSFELPMNQI